jgi:hypothetical protein
MHALYEFVSGPMVWAAFGLFFNYWRRRKYGR